MSTTLVRTAAVALLVLAAGFAAAADPAPGPGVLLLTDFSLAEGTVEAFGPLFRVTPAAGGPPRIVPARDVLFTAATRDDVAAFMTKRAAADPATGQVQLANWFAKIGDHDRAAVEARTAAAAAPTDEVVQALATKYEAAAATPRPAPKPAAKPKPVAAPAAPPAGTSAAAGTLFGNKIQPILSNLCAKCHAHAKYAGAFKLERVPEGYVPPATAAANLAAAVGQLDRDDPAASPLLANALTAHGGDARPPITTAAHPAYRALESWVKLAVGPLPTKPKFVSAPDRPAAAVLAAVEKRISPVPPPRPVATTSAAPPRPPARNPADPFDPAEFNTLPRKQ